MNRKLVLATRGEAIEPEVHPYAVPGLERGLKILCEFNRAETVLGAPELASRLGIPRSTVFRLLQTLEKLGFLQRAEDGRSYKLGVAVLRIGFEYLASLSLVELGRPLLERLRDETGFSVHLVIRDGRSIVCVAKVIPVSPLLASSVDVGTRLPAHATVLGRVLLSDMTLKELHQLYPERRLAKFSDQTPETVRSLFAMLQADRERGFAIGEGFYDHAVSIVAAPVRDESAQIVAALGLVILRPHIDPELQAGLIERVLEAASELSKNLNYRGEAHAVKELRNVTHIAKKKGDMGAIA